MIGVVKDFHVRSLHSEIEPMMMQLVPNPDPLHYIAVRITPENISGTIEFLRSSWQEVYPQDTFAFSFLDEDFNSQYQTEERRGQIFRNFSLLAVFIACLGLLGLASFTAEQRTKEIGVRKVLGASIGSIMVLPSKEFIKLVLLASLIAWPVAYLMMDSWLDNFAYRTTRSPWLFLLSAALAVVITLVTVGDQAIKAARTNPVTALQYE